MNKKPGRNHAAMHDCPGYGQHGRCYGNRRTTKARCAFCQREVNRLAREQAAIRKVAGSPLSLGAEAFLASLATPDGCTREDIRSEAWRTGDPTWPGVRFTGHDGQTTIEVFVERLDDQWAVGSGHTRFTTARGQFSFDRHGVEDSFYVEAKDTAVEMAVKLAEQLARAQKSREAHLTSVKVPFVGHIVSPERRDEIAKKLQAGGSHSFTPSGFGTGYRCTTQRKQLTRWCKVAPQAMADFFGVPVLYYDELDCD